MLKKLYLTYLYWKLARLEGKTKRISKSLASNVNSPELTQRPVDFYVKNEGANEDFAFTHKEFPPTRVEIGAMNIKKGLKLRELRDKIYALRDKISAWGGNLDHPATVKTSNDGITIRRFGKKETKSKYCVQLDGSPIDNLEVDSDIPESELKRIAVNIFEGTSRMDGKTVDRVIVIKDRLINLVTKAI